MHVLNKNGVEVGKCAKLKYSCISRDFSNTNCTRLNQTNLAFRE